MSNTGANSSVPDTADEPRKKGARGGKRSVTHLSKAQLARKRANDREAQRNIRQRTKEHIGNLERKVKELEQNGRSGSMERVLKRNQDLEAEIERLRAQLSARATGQPTSRISSEIPEELLMPSKVELEWIPATSSWNNPDIPSHSNGSYPSSEAPSYTPNSYEDEQPQPLYSSNASPVWNEQVVFGSNGSQPLSKSSQAWAYQSSYPSSRFSSPVPSQTRNFSEQVNPSSYTPPCWQSQPSIYAWQMSTKMKTPHTYIDQLMISK